jgi:3-methyladenine DNA glycosylase AlkC
MPLHPSERFQAPSTIPTGVPLKSLINSNLIRLIGESFSQVLSTFNRREFERQASSGLENLELTARGRHIGQALASQLPQPFEAAAPVLIAALGPELTKTEGNGLAAFFYLPHSYVIADHGPADFDAAMWANYELTKRFTAEFCLRPTLVQHRRPALRRLMQWTSDPNPHVRRLVSEGTRPRLPWAMRLREFQADPQLALPLLERLKDDPEQYVRRSVANHLGDILKDHPEVAYSVCERWIAEAGRTRVAAERRRNRFALLRHAVRLSAKKGDARAAAIREAAR